MELLRASAEKRELKVLKHRRVCKRVKLFRILSMTTLALLSLKGSMGVITSQFNFIKNFSFTSLLVCVLPMCLSCYCIYRLMREFKII